jgi:hypothetical protein
MKIITTIIRQIELNAVRKESTKLIEEFADCFMKIMKAIRVIPLNETADEASEENTIQSIRSILKSDFLERIHPLSISNSELLGLSNKARFTFLDIYENIQQF